ncbi:MULTISPECIES: hypothetical protein [Spirulina sp. CCY15215]|uniref:hypothetical protein n=1 Tax=Spirulina sp. CCY15215 TaxID=2767591 RepID=UPI00194E9048|nr:hypothetical protein [Spirulina major]
MGSWTQAQRSRLSTERQILNKYFPAFDWINPTDSNKTYVKGILKTNSGNNYIIGVYLSSDYPNSQPNMFVLSPLQGYLGKDFSEHGASASMHTLSPSNGCVKICHYKGWTPNLTLYKVILKGRIWLEAFESHKRTGKTIDSFLKHMN